MGLIDVVFWLWYQKGKKVEINSFNNRLKRKLKKIHVMY